MGRILTVENRYDILPDLSGTILKENNKDAYIAFDNGEHCWVSKTAFIIIK